MDLPFVTSIKFQSVQRTPIIPLLVKGWLEILESGYDPDNHIGIDESHEAIGAFDVSKGRFAGVISFRTSINFAVVCIGYVDPEYRGKGIYTKLFKDLEDEISSRGIQKIGTFISANNTKMIEIAKSQGRVLEFVCYSKILNPVVKAI